MTGPPAPGEFVEDLDSDGSERIVMERLTTALEEARRESRFNAADAHQCRKEINRLSDRLTGLEEALRQIQARARAIPANPIGNEIEDLARKALSASPGSGRGDNLDDLASPLLLGNELRDGSGPVEEQ